MNIGMLWFSNHPEFTVEQKIQEAAQYYQSKYGRIPNLCFIHPTLVTDAMKRDGVKYEGNKIEIRPNRSVKPNHFWIGLKD